MAADVFLLYGINGRGEMVKMSTIQSETLSTLVAIVILQKNNDMEQ